MKKLYVLTDYAEIFDAKAFTYDEWVAARREANRASHGHTNWLLQMDCLANLPWHEEEQIESSEIKIKNYDDFMEALGPCGTDFIDEQ